MNKIKKYEMPILISISILVFIALVSVSYAYFKARINNLESVSTIAFTSSEMTINYENNSAVLTGTNITPGWSTTKTFTLKGKNDSKPTDTQPDNNMYYKIGIAVDINTFTQDAIKYLLEKDSTSSANGQMQDATYGSVPQTGTKYIGKGYFTETSTYVNHIYKLTISFPDNGENQYKDNDKQFAAHVVIEKSSSSETIDTPSVPTATYYIANLYETSADNEGLEQDDTDDKNIRYVGATPKNYIKFNNETWRIIGVFNDITTIDENGNKNQESLIKIIRNESLGEYSWDTCESSINSGNGINEWSQADLMYELNCDGNENSLYCREDIVDGYLSLNPTTESPTWYNGTNNTKTATYDYGKNIKSSEVGKIANVIWNLGGYSTAIVTAYDMYNYERGYEYISNPSDGENRTTIWTGKIGLMYPSDYGYASTDTTCRSNLNDISCSNLNWLFNNEHQWTLTPSSNLSTGAFYLYQAGYFGNRAYVRNTEAVRPVLFLKSNVVITTGVGEVEDPYIIG